MSSSTIDSLRLLSATLFNSSSVGPGSNGKCQIMFGRIDRDSTQTLAGSEIGFTANVTVTDRTPTEVIRDEVSSALCNPENREIYFKSPEDFKFSFDPLAQGQTTNICGSLKILKSPIKNPNHVERNYSFMPSTEKTAETKYPESMHRHWENRNNTATATYLLTLNPKLLANDTKAQDEIEELRNSLLGASERSTYIERSISHMHDTLYKLAYSALEAIGIPNHQHKSESIEIPTGIVAMGHPQMNNVTRYTRELPGDEITTHDFGIQIARINSDLQVPVSITATKAQIAELNEKFKAAGIAEIDGKGR